MFLDLHWLQSYFQDRKNTKAAVNDFGHYHYNNKRLRIGRNLWCTSVIEKEKSLLYLSKS